MGILLKGPKLGLEPDYQAPGQPHYRSLFRFFYFIHFEVYLIFQFKGTLYLFRINYILLILAFLII